MEPDQAARPAKCAKQQTFNFPAIITGVPTRVRARTLQNYLQLLVYYHIHQSSYYLSALLPLRGCSGGERWRWREETLPSSNNQPHSLSISIFSHSKHQSFRLQQRVWLQLFKENHLCHIQLFIITVVTQAHYCHNSNRLIASENHIQMSANTRSTSCRRLEV